jgi:hypothetical protein
VFRDLQSSGRLSVGRERGLQPIRTLIVGREAIDHGGDGLAGGDIDLDLLDAQDARAGQLGDRGRRPQPA